MAILVVPGGLALVTTAPPPSTAGGPAVVVPGLAPVSGDATNLTVAPAFLPSSGTTTLGPLSSGTELTVDVGVALSDPAGLGAYVSAMYGSGAPARATELTPAEVGDLYGPSPASVALVQQYFRSFGLSVATASNDLVVSVSGPSSELGRAFGTTFEGYRAASGRTFFDHSAAATLPRALAVSGVYGLGNVTPILPDVAGVPSPPAPTGSAGSCTYAPDGNLDPCQIATAYNISSLVEAGTNGTGERIGVVDAYDGGESQDRLSVDFSDFAEVFGLPAAGVNFAYPVSTAANLNTSSTNPDWGLEEALDLEWARASAPGAAITMTFAPDAGPGLLTAVNWLVATDAVNVISMSWGEPLTGVFNAATEPCSSACNASTDGTLAILDPVFETAAAEGISVFAATGDCGSADGTSGQAVNYPAADPWVTAVGGTLLNIDPNGSYLSERAWSGNATGASPPGCTNQGGSGGGYASLPRPSWQVGLPTTPPGRATPDVSLDAATAVVVVYGASYEGVIGTSVGTPIWAGIGAIADQKAGSPLGFLDPSFYRVYTSSSYSRDFHDVLSGTNGYDAGTGWDAVTGLGSPVVDALVGDLTAPAAPGANSLRPFLYAAPRFGRAPLTVSFAVEVSGGTGSDPVEEVVFGDGNASAASGVVSHTYTDPGVYSASAFVLDSADGSASSPPIAIVVGGGGALNVSMTTADASVAIGAPVTFDLNASGGVAPNLFDVTFGDGTYLTNETGPNVTHAYAAVGGYCAEAVGRDARAAPDGGASARVAISVGGAPFPDCENDTSPLVLTPTPGPHVQDASVEFTDLFSVVGGASAPDGLAGSLQVRTADPYAAACQCAIFRTPGNYSVTAWYNDTVGEGAMAVTNVTVTPALDGVFTASALLGTAPFEVSFTASVSGGDLANAGATKWLYGDGFSGTGAAVEETYTEPGSYVAVAHLEDQGQGNASEAFLIDILAPGGSNGYGIGGTIAPAVDLTSGTTVAFTSQVREPPGGPAVQASWDLGDGYSAVASAPSETYYGPLPLADGNTLDGEVSVVLPNTQAMANLSWSLPSFFATGAGGGVPRSQALALSSSLGPTHGRSPLTTRARADATGPGGASVEWTFGDGGLNASARAVHTYAEGIYTATATARDAIGDRSVESFAVAAFGALDITGGPSPASGAPPLTVTFTALALGGSGPPYTYRWTFGGSNQSTGPTVVRSYAAPGVYSATVNVTDGDGDNASRAWTVTVALPPPFSPALLLSIAAAVGVGGGIAAYFRSRTAPGTGPGPSGPSIL